MSDMTARAREQRIAEIRERERKATKGPWQRYGRIGGNMGLDRVQWCDGQDARTGRDQYLDVLPDARNADFIAHARADIPFLLEQLAAQSAAPVEEVAREIAKLSYTRNHTQGRDLSEGDVSNILRQHGYGAQPTIEQLYEAAKVIYSGDTRKDLFALEGLALHRHRDTGEMKYLVEALECRVTLKDFDSKFPDPLNGAQEQPSKGDWRYIQQALEDVMDHFQCYCKNPDDGPCAVCEAMHSVELIKLAALSAPVPSPESAAPQHGICPNCGADRSGPSAEAHATNCPESATKRCEVCGATENLTVMGRNQYACPEHRATRSAEEKR